MSKILILGDLHGQFHDLNSVMRNVEMLGIEYDFVIQVGDFGFYPENFSEKLDKFHSKLIKTGKKIDGICDYTYAYEHIKFHKPVHVICGNHENHEFIKKSDHKKWEEKYNIIYKPRGSWVNIDGYKIGFLGGALNADQAQEGSTAKETTNYVLNKQVERALKEWNAVGGMDTVVTHSCPTNLGIGMEGSPFLFATVEKYIVNAGHGSSNFMDCGEHALTKLYNGLVKKPSWWFFGHFHQSHAKKINDTVFVCVGSTDTSDGKKYVNPHIINTETNQFDIHTKKALNFDGEHSTYIKED